MLAGYYPFHEDTGFGSRLNLSIEVDQDGCQFKLCVLNPWWFSMSRKRGHSDGELCGLTEEQVGVVMAMERGHVCVNAGPGTGKSTLIISLVRYLSRSTANILVLQFNRAMREDMEARIRASEPGLLCRDGGTVRVMTHSGLAFHLLKHTPKDGPPSPEDCLRLSNEPPGYYRVGWQRGQTRILIIDEAQDMSRVDWRIAIRHAANPGTRVLLVGDERQDIYKVMRDAESRYLRLLPEILTAENHNLTLTHRLTEPMVDFVNQVFLSPETHLRSHRPSHHPVTLLRYRETDRETRTQRSEAVIHALRLIFATSDAKPADVLVLAPSIEKSFDSLPDAIQNLEIEGRTVSLSRTQEQHVRFRTFHSVKGLEARFVIVLCFDESYVRFFDKTTPLQRIPSALFVAITRAKERLFLVAEATNPPLPCADLIALKALATDPRKLLVLEQDLANETWVETQTPHPEISTLIQSDKPTPVSVVDFLKAAHQEDLSSLYAFDRVQTSQLPSQEILWEDLNLPTETIPKGQIVGKLVYLFFEHFALGKPWAETNFYEELSHRVEAQLQATDITKANEGRYLACQNLLEEVSQSEDLREEDALWNLAAVREATWYVPNFALLGVEPQELIGVEEAAWIGQQVFACIQTSGSNPSETDQVEDLCETHLDCVYKCIPAYQTRMESSMKLEGRVDLIQTQSERSTIVEFKLGGDQRVCDLWQVLIYATLWLETTGREQVDFKLAYLLNGSVYTGTLTKEEATMIIVPALQMTRAWRAPTWRSPTISDAEFVREERSGLVGVETRPLTRVLVLLPGRFLCLEAGDRLQWIEDREGVSLHDWILRGGRYVNTRTNLFPTVDVIACHDMANVCWEWVQDLGTGFERDLEALHTTPKIELGPFQSIQDTLGTLSTLLNVQPCSPPREVSYVFSGPQYMGVARPVEPEDWVSSWGNGTLFEIPGGAALLSGVGVDFETTFLRTSQSMLDPGRYVDFERGYICLATRLDLAPLIELVDRAWRVLMESGFRFWFEDVALRMDPNSLQAMARGRNQNQIAGGILRIRPCPRDKSLRNLLDTRFEPRETKIGIRLLGFQIKNPRVSQTGSGLALVEPLLQITSLVKKRA